MEYTKGEWVVVGRKSVAYSGYHIWDNTQGTLLKEVAIVYPNPQGKSDIYGEANARLIAAAPKQHEALKEIDRWLLDNPYVTNDPQLHIIHIHIKEAITKVEGGNNGGAEGLKCHAK